VRVEESVYTAPLIVAQFKLLHRIRAATKLFGRIFFFAATTKILVAYLSTIHFFCGLFYDAVSI
jgi:hypothetical protein